MTNWLSSNPFGDDLNWITPPENQGQIIEVSYASDGEFLYRSSFDQSDRSETIARVDWDEIPEVEYEPWNYAPEVDEDLWEVVQRR